MSQSDYVPRDRRELCGRLFHTVYMATENSSLETKSRAKLLSQQIGRFVAQELACIPSSTYHPGCLNEGMLVDMNVNVSVNVCMHALAHLPFLARYITLVNIKIESYLSVPFF